MEPTTSYTQVDSVKLAMSNAEIHFVHIGLQTDSSRFGSKSVWTVHMKHAHKYV